MTVEDFIKMVASAVAQQVASAPPKSFSVNRTNVSGQSSAQTTQLPQIMAELTDTLRLDLEFRKQHILQTQQVLEAMRLQNESLEDLINEMRENNNLAKRHLKKLKAEAEG